MFYFLLSFFFLVSIQKILQTPSIQIDAQRVCVSLLRRFDHSNETVLVRKIAIRFRLRRAAAAAV